VQVEADWFFEFVKAGYVEPWRPESHEQNTVVMNAVAAAAEAYANAGWVTIVEGIVIPRWFLQPLLDAFRADGREVAYAVLRVPLELCRERVAGRGGEPLGPPEVVEQIWNQFEDLGEWESHAIDAEASSPAELADELERRLDAGDLLCP
jgi:hypothetical protein